MKTRTTIFGLITLGYLLVLTFSIFVLSNVFMGSVNFGRYMSEVVYGFAHLGEVTMVVTSVIGTWILSLSVFLSESIDNFDFWKLSKWIFSMCFAAFLVYAVVVIVVGILGLIWAVLVFIFNTFLSMWSNFMTGFTAGR